MTAIKAGFLRFCAALEMINMGNNIGPIIIPPNNQRFYPSHF
ncbi:hypothetical protein GPAL_1578 [Glaciecola pallidula DSM 14239 = ACAM 615]|uniref:Uncharacterized protein n=1 Tax=Brumicola pallidula DSM 14239 = ACAM 615 TaxID=1121922 RepID=K6ZDN3_9ALTE|nr:hypothetical protein GPAL_1578 [Glaciecola pallidula DSM 14239 = ACAM 615]